LVARLRQGRQAPTPSIRRRDPDAGDLPLSFGQEQLWFIDQLAPAMSVYNVPGGLRLRGELDVRALGRALDALLARHEALRTRLVTVEGRPQQVIDAPQAGTLMEEDLSSLAPAAQKPRLRELAAVEAAIPFDLAAGPLFRARLVRLAAQEHVLVITVHHAVFDGWSFGVFTRELAALYAEQVTGQPAGLADLPVQFADYALWERQRLQGDELQSLVEFWRRTLDGVITVQMPTDRPRPLLQRFEGGVAHLSADSSVLDGLRTLSRREGTTLFVTLLTALQVLLHRYSGQDDITVGTASANRTRPELAPMIGYLVNTLPIRTDTSGDPSFLELLHKVRAATLEAYAHQDLPFAKIVEALRVERDPSRSPLFQIGFTMTEESGEPVQVADVTVSFDSVDFLPAKVDLNFFAEIVGSRMELVLSYATALYDEQTARRMLDHLAVLLSGIVSDPSRRLSQLPMLTSSELRRELVDWNRTDHPYPVMCLHELFERQVERTPEAVAAAMEDEEWTYAELNRQANQIAQYLHERGVGAETIVGISMPVSLRRLAGLLGIMKAGAGYVPLDPSLPPDRLGYMIADTRTPIILADTASAAALPDSSAETIDLEAHWAAIAAHPSENSDYPVTPTNIAYVIYTSGSTGRPKGVIIEHVTVVNYIQGTSELLSLGADDRYLQFASLNFDVSVMDMFVTLCSGATAVFASREILHSPPRLADMMRRQRVTGACLPPAVLHLLTGQELPDLRVLTSAGEELSTHLARAWLRPGLRLLNGYGPTEATCGTTFMELSDATLPPPIGSPGANYKAYVLDRHLNPVPLGATGELHVGGRCLARGYLNQPELTAQRFIADPFSDRPGARLYKTGDLVRRLPDGNIMFLGRTDGQVKIRGLRVELGEIESILSSHRAVVQAHVKATRDLAGQLQLIGYARLDADASVSTGELRQHLAAQLPGYMVPAHLVVLDAFPLTPSGKIDSNALPAPAASASSGYTPPTTLTEALIVDLFASLLGLPQVGIDDGFFDVGGNSLQAMQLVSQLHDELAVDLDVTAVFLAPTARQFASMLREHHGVQDVALPEEGLKGLETDGGEHRARLDGDITLFRPIAQSASTGSAAGDPGAVGRRPHSGCLRELTSGPGQQPLFIIHPISGTVYAYAGLAGELAATYKVYGLEAAGLSPGSAAVIALEEMLSRYVEAIRATQPQGPYRLAGWSMGGQLAFEIARRLEALDEAVDLLVLIDASFYGLPARLPSDAVLAKLFAAEVGQGGGFVGANDAPAERWINGDLDWLAERLDGGAGNVAAARAEIERRFDVYKANTRVMAGYRPTGTVNAPTLLVSAEDSFDWSLEWQSVIGGEVGLVRIPGQHYTVLQPPGVQRLAAAMLGGAQSGQWT
jgi:amino acid adenylation domain-containing protein